MRKFLFAFLFVYGLFTNAHAEGTFTITTIEMPAGTTFSFQISAAGNFTINWGDIDCSETKTDANSTPCIQTINKTNTYNTTYSYRYATAGSYNIKLSGQATAYNNYISCSSSCYNSIAAISFEGNTNLLGIEGSLGQIFSTINGTSQPRFDRTFYNCTNLSSTIPEKLFDGIDGPTIKRQFYRVFSDCVNLKGNIPNGLFAGAKGPLLERMFASAFYNCTGLTGSIPEDLFAGLSGDVSDTYNAMSGMFNGCSGLTGQIPKNLFKNLTGTPSEAAFDGAFYGTSLTGYVPSELFSGLSGLPTTVGFVNVFENTQMDTTCPSNTIEAQKPNPDWTVAVCSPKCNDDEIYTGIETCAQICASQSVKYLNIGTNIKIPLYDNQQTTPSLVIEYNNKKCYGNLVPGYGSNALNLNIQNQPFHLIN